MLFNSLEFFIFLPTVFLLYWFAFSKNIRIQNFFLLGVSYVFYGWWDWRFLFLIIFSSFVDYSIGLRIGAANNEKRRKYLLLISLLVNLGLLGFFKYFNFFVESFAIAFTFFGGSPDISTLNIILPVGISFYTFQTMSYSLDIYNRKIEPQNDLPAFMAFVSFFPQLVAGPIERAERLLPQFFTRRHFDKKKASDGMRQILLGFLKKILIADTCAPIVSDIFSNYSDYTSITLLYGSVLFIIQIYCDFSGYSDIAIGTARLFGFDLVKNFDSPYLSKSTTEIWRRWHISLGNWFNSYLFNPLAKHFAVSFNTAGIVIGLVLTFTIIGFWHGANWTFILFGLIHGIVLSLEMLTKKQRRKLSKRLSPSIFNLLGWGITMLIWILTCILFRSESVLHAINYMHRMITQFQVMLPQKLLPLSVFIIFGVYFILEFIQKSKEHTFDLSKLNVWLRWSFYVMVFFLIMSYGQFNNDNFIYFQF